MKYFKILHIINAFVLCALALNASEPRVFYVATNGNDGWSGKLNAPNPERNDGPLASLQGARDAIRRGRSSQAIIEAPINIMVRQGAYRLSSPFILEPQDSGTAEAPVTYQAYPGERPVFSGGQNIRGFSQKGTVWEVDLAMDRPWYFRQLFVNGQRRQLARSPNAGYHRIAALLPGPPSPNAKPVAREKFGFKPGDIKPWARLGDVNVVLMHSWETSIHPIKSVDVVSNIVHFTAPLKEWWTIGYWEDAQRYYVENAFELLDQPGEWYLNRESGVLTYWPMPGERLGEVEVAAPMLTELVRFTGDADKGLYVKNITIKGLAFHHADWMLDPKGNSSTQAAVETPAVVTADGAVQCAFEDCEIAHIGTYGIWFRRGCKDCRIQQNRLFDLGAGGIRVGETVMARTDEAETSRILIDNNHISNGGRVFAAGIGIWLAQSSSNQISHNDIHDLFYSGISIGWNWDLSKNRTHHNLIEYNHVHNLVHGVLSDAGLIYCLGVSPGSVIRNNVFHDIWPYSRPAFGWGIYLDAQCGNYLVESNIVYNTLSGGLMYNNGGHEHMIRNNIFALSANHALWPYFEKRPNTFSHNIVYLSQGELFIPYGERSFNERIAAKEPLGVWDSNLYWHAGGVDKLRFNRHSFSEWQTLGLDTKSRIADPLFRDLDKHNFELSTNSPARELGIQSLDISRVGLYGDKKWVCQARHESCAPLPLSALAAPVTGKQYASAIDASSNLFKIPFFALDNGIRDAQHSTPESQAKLLKQLGFDGVGWKPDEVPEMLSALDREGLKMFNVYIGVDVDGTNRTAPENILKLIRQLKGRDTAIWLYVTSKKYSKPSDEAGDVEAVELLRDIADRAQAANLTVALYPHTWFWVERIQDAVRLAKKVNRPNLGVTFNLCHCLKVGDGSKIPVLLDMARPYLHFVTINGANFSGDWDQLIQPLGQGEFDVAALLKQFRQIGYRGPVGLQHYGIKGDVSIKLKQSMDAWQRMLRQ